MDTKVLIAGIVGFMMGGLLVSIAATTFENDELQQEPMQTQSRSM